jgi:hypothetical protein
VQAQLAPDVKIVWSAEIVRLELARIPYREYIPGVADETARKEETTMTRDDFDRAHNVRNDGQGCMTAINLEGLTDEELAIASKHPALHSDVAIMAGMTRTARAARLRGDIALALRLEAKAERLYDTLPKCLRW